MLPVFKRKDEPTVIIKTRSPDKDNESRDLDEAKHPSQDIQPCAEDLIHSIQANDAEGVARAIYDMHEIMHGRMSPKAYSEGEGNQAFPHSYDAQKEED